MQGLIQQSSSSGSSSSRSDSESPESGKVFPVGLLNQGATCYLNSLLQVLHHTPEFRQAILLFGGGSPSSKSLRAFKVLFTRLNRLHTGDLNGHLSVSTRALTQSVGIDTSLAQEQQDIGELFIKLVQFIKGKNAFDGPVSALRANDWPRLVDAAIEEEEEPMAELKEGSQERYSLCDYLWSVHTGQRVVCQDCSNSSQTVSPNFELPVYLRMGAMESKDPKRQRLKLVDCLNAQFGPGSDEMMCGVNAYLCNECGLKTTAQKSQRILHNYLDHSDEEKEAVSLRLPPVLCLTLKRIDFDKRTGRVHKITNPFEFPFVLDVSPYVCDPSWSPAADPSDSDPKDLEYALFAVVMHKGSSANHGHYHAYVRDFTNEFLRVDPLKSARDIRASKRRSRIRKIPLSDPDPPSFIYGKKDEEYVPSDEDNEHDAHDEAEESEDSDSEENGMSKYETSVCRLLKQKCEESRSGTIGLRPALKEIESMREGMSTAVRRSSGGINLRKLRSLVASKFSHKLDLNGDLISVKDTSMSSSTKKSAAMPKKLSRNDAILARLARDVMNEQPTLNSSDLLALMKSLCDSQSEKCPAGVTEHRLITLLSKLNEFSVIKEGRSALIILKDDARSARSDSDSGDTIDLDSDVVMSESRVNPPHLSDSGVGPESWFDFDDENVRPISSSLVRSLWKGGEKECPYLLFYRQVSSISSLDSRNQVPSILVNSLVELEKSAIVEESVMEEGEGRSDGDSLSIRITQVFAAQGSSQRLSVRTACESVVSAEDMSVQMDDLSIVSEAAPSAPSSSLMSLVINERAQHSDVPPTGTMRRRVRGVKKAKSTRTKAASPPVTPDDELIILSDSSDDEVKDSSPSLAAKSTGRKRRLTESKSSDSPEKPYNSCGHRQLKPLVCSRSTMLGDFLAFLSGLLGCEDCNRLVLFVNQSSVTRLSKPVDLADPATPIHRAGFHDGCELLVIDQSDCVWEQRGQSLSDGALAMHIAEMERSRRTDPKRCVQFRVLIRTDGEFSEGQSHTFYMDASDNYAGLCVAIANFTQESALMEHALFYGVLRDDEEGFFVSDFDTPFVTMFSLRAGGSSKKEVRSVRMTYNHTRVHQMLVSQVYQGSRESGLELMDCSDDSDQKKDSSGMCDGSTIDSSRLCHIRFVFKDGKNSVNFDPMPERLHNDGGIADVKDVSGYFEMIIDKHTLTLSELRQKMIEVCGLRKELRTPMEVFDLRFCNKKFSLKVRGDTDFMHFCDVVESQQSVSANARRYPDDSDEEMTCRKGRSQSEESIVPDGRDMTVEQWLILQPRKKKVKTKKRITAKSTSSKRRRRSGGGVMGSEDSAMEYQTPRSLRLILHKLKHESLHTLYFSSAVEPTFDGSGFQIAMPSAVRAEMNALCASLEAADSLDESMTAETIGRPSKTIHLAEMDESMPDWDGLGLVDPRRIATVASAEFDFDNDTIADVKRWLLGNCKLLGLDLKQIRMSVFRNDLKIAHHRLVKDDGLSLSQIGFATFRQNNRDKNRILHVEILERGQSISEDESVLHLCARLPRLDPSEEESKQQSLFYEPSVDCVILTKHMKSLPLLKAAVKKTLRLKGDPKRIALARLDPLTHRLTVITETPRPKRKKAGGKKGKSESEVLLKVDPPLFDKDTIAVIPPDQRRVDEDGPAVISQFSTRFSECMRQSWDGDHSVRRSLVLLDSDNEES